MIFVFGFSAARHVSVAVDKSCRSFSLATRVRVRHRLCEAPRGRAKVSKTGKGDLRTPPEVSNAVRVVLDWIVDFAA